MLPLTSPVLNYRDLFASFMNNRRPWHDTRRIGLKRGRGVKYYPHQGKKECERRRKKMGEKLMKMRLLEQSQAEIRSYL